MQEPLVAVFWEICLCSVTKLCLTLCDLMDCSTPGFPVFHCLLEFVQTLSTESVTPCNHLILCCPFLLLPSVFPSVGWKRCTMWELWVKFYLGQNEDCSPGNNISDSLDILLQRDGGERSVYMWFWWSRENMQPSTYFCRSFLLVLLKLLLVARNSHHHEGF